MRNTGRNFSLSDHHRSFVDAQVESGRHASGSEVVREALRRYEDDIEREQSHRRYLDRLADDGEAAYQRGDFVQIERRDVAAFVRKASQQA